MNTPQPSQTRPPKLAVSKACLVLLRCLLLVACFAGWQQARATLFFTDQFNYPDNVNLGATTGPWNTTTAGTGDNSTQLKVTTASAQTSPSGYFTAAYNGVVVAPAGSNKKNAALFNGATGVPAVAGNVVYASFLLNVRTLPSANMRVAYMHNGSSSSGTMEVIVSSTGQVGIQKKGNASSLVFASGTPVATPGTHLIVMRYTFITGSSNDELALWVDPSNYGAASAPAGYTTANTSAVSDMANTFTTIVIDSPGLAAGPVFWIDEVRVADTWADVTPSSGSCDTAAVTANPSNVAVAAGATANFTITATGTSPTYQWEYSTDSGANWSPVSGGTGATTVSYTTAPTDVSQNNYQYHCVVSVACDSSTATSAAATLTVSCNTAGVSANPVDASVNAGQTATFTITATGSSPTYQWEYSPDSGANWYPVFDGTGATTASYTTAALTTGQNGYLYHCVVNVACDSSTATSSSATLTVSCSAAGITSNPVNSTAAVGSTANFAVTATGSSPTYQWEYSPDSGANWFPVSSGTGGTTASYTTAALTSGENGYQYHCVVNVACDVSTATSSAATLTVVDPAMISFRSATSGNWQDTSTWEMSVNNGASWSPAGIIPAAANCTNILISAGTSVSNLLSRTVDQVVVAAGGTLVVSGTLTVAAGSALDLDVQGTLVVVGGSSALTLQSGVAMEVKSGGVFAHDGTSGTCVNFSGATITVKSGGTFQLRRAGGTVPIVTWNPGSTCEIAYSTASSTRPNNAGMVQNFENFTWNNPLQSAGVDLAGSLTNINGNFLLAAANGFEVKWSGDANFGGNLTINDGSLNISGNSTPRAWTLKGDLTIGSGGTFNLSATASAQSVLTLNGSGAQNYTCNGNNTATKLSWIVNSGSTLNLNSDLALSIGGRTLTADGTVNLNGHTLIADLLAGAGTVRNQGGGSGLLVLGAGNGVNTLGTAPSLVNGASGSLGLGKSGSGTLTITDPQTFSGGLVVSNGTVLVNNASGSGTGNGAVSVVGGTLGGTGIIAGAVTIGSAGNLAPGASIDDLTINGVLTLNGNFTSEVNTGSSPNTDQVLGTSAVNYGGTLTINNLGAALTTADTFQIFPAGTRSGTFTLAPATPDNNAGLAWDTSTLTTDGTLRIVTGVVASPNLGVSQSGSTLTFSWSEAGFKLQSQTNSLTTGLGNTWLDYPGGATSPVNVNIDPANPTVFFRLSQ
ncbi:MAG TPA: hypothetical protein VL863_02960 [bacterium]|nr:hypothetical protein [bacterium]